MGKFKYNITLSDAPLVKLNKAQDGTVKDLKEMLRVHKIALMIRPTGFGKTFTMIKLCKAERYKRVIYMYPTDVIKQSIEHDYHNEKKEDGIVYAATPEEQKLYKNLPYIDFISYRKMLMDWNKFAEQMEEMDEETKDKLGYRWAERKFADVDLLILDEAHMTGAEGFLKYWKYIHRLTQEGVKDSRLHVLGATATPLRTNPEVDIERDIFYYTYGGEKHSARIKDFTFIDCWRLGIMITPFYTKGMIDKEDQRDYLTNKLHNVIVGCDIGDDPTIRKVGRPGKSSKVKIVNDPRAIYTQSLYSSEQAKLSIALSNVPSPSKLIYNAVNEVVGSKVSTGEYMRFLVFYQNTEDMVQYHNKINDAFTEAFNIGSENSLFKELNVRYILSNEERLKDSGIERSRVSVIKERDEELINNPNLGHGCIDLIHSINMLNMGYHVGHVTGVVVKRSTSSEIIYYQQIGRCMSIKSETKPLIIDFANAEAELFSSTHDTIREEASAKIKEFIGQCDLSDDYEKTNNVYSLLRMSITDGRLSDELLEYLYCDRNAPIYFIKGVSDSMNCSESIEEIIVRLSKILTINNKGLLVPDDFALNEPRLHSHIVGSASKVGLIQEEINIFNKRELMGGLEDA